MRKNVLSVGLALLMFGEARLVMAEDLSGIRAAADSRECSVTHEGRREPVVALTASAYDLPGVDKQEVIGLLDRFLAYGCSIQEPDRQGMSPINVAILIAEADLLLYLLKAGGDPEQKITGSRPWANGRNSIEFAQALYKVDASNKRKKFIDILSSH